MPKTLRMSDITGGKLLLAADPRAVGLKNGGLREITHDIINVVSRAERGAFQSGVQQELRWRSDSSRMWLP
jgi:hypothetical protein